MKILSPITLFVGVALSNVGFAGTYDCVLKARDNVMQQFETVEAVFDGERPLEINAKGFRMLFKVTGAADNRQMAMLLGADQDHSAVTLSRLGEYRVYLNLMHGERFAVSECLARAE